jgi:hypothetical protein
LATGTEHSQRSGSAFGKANSGTKRHRPTPVAEAFAGKARQRSLHTALTPG